MRQRRDDCKMIEVKYHEEKLQLQHTHDQAIQKVCLCLTCLLVCLLVTNVCEDHTKQDMNNAKFYMSLICI